MSDRSPTAARRTLKRTPRMPAVERRAQLIEVARSVFAERGYYGTSMDDVAERAGVTKPVLYQHFESKKDLYLALIDEASLSIARAVWSATGTWRDPWRTTLEGFRAYFEYVRDNPASFNILFSDAEADPQIRERIDGIRALISERVTVLLRLSPMGEWASPEQLGLASTGIIGMAEMVGRRWISTGRSDPATAAAALADIVAKGFGGNLDGGPEPAE